MADSMNTDRSQTTAEEPKADGMIEAHLRSALTRLARGDIDSLEGAQRNIEYARNRMRDLIGPLPGTHS